MANPESRMKELPQSTVRLLGSSQVITSIYSVVKELLENSLDANSSSVDVKLENFGLDRIEVRDNGDGIPKTDISFVARRYYTSKLSAFSDLEQLTTYGFRGEALGSLCTVADLSVTTKTKEEDVSSTFTFSKEGEIIDTKPSHVGQGTTMLAAHIFKNLPVRRQFYNNVKKKKEELKKVETLVMSFGLIFPKLRITLRHNKDIVWQKNPVQDLRSSVTGILGKNVFNQMEYKSVKESDPEISVEMYVPSQGSDPQVTGRSNTDRCFIYVNSRPVILKDIEKLLKQYYTASHSCEGTRVPVCCVLIVLPSSEIDVNLDPNKTKVLLHHQVSVSNIVKNLLEEVYGPLEPSKTHHKQNLKIDSSKNSDQPSEWRMDLTRESPENDSIVKITAVENPEKRNGQKIPIFNVTMETGHNSLTENATINDQVINKGNEFYPGKESLLDDSNVDFSELEVPSVPSDVITPPIESIKNQGKEKHLKEEIVQIQKGCFDIVGDCFKDVLSDDESQCTLKGDYSNSHTKGDNSLIKGDKPDLQPKLLLQETNSDLFDDSLTDVLRNFNETLHEEVSMVSSKQPEDNTRAETTPAGELWSKGQMAVNSGSAVLQPVRLLSAGNSKRPLTSPPDLSTPSKKRNIMPEEGQPTLYDMVSGQPVQRGQAGYRVFLTENRPAVVTKNPTASFDEVTDILKDQWENLSQEDQQKYNSTSDSPRGNSFSKKHDRPLGNKMKLKTKQAPGFSIKDQLLMAAKKKNSKPETCISFSMENLRKTFSRQLYSSQLPKTTKLSVIGHLKSCLTWTCCVGEKICILNCHRIQETVLYHQLMSDHVLSVTFLDQPIKLTPQNIGGKNHWDCLFSLDSNRFPGDIYSFITDERIVDNGFKVRSYTDKETGSSQADIVAMADFIPVYGVPDLAEVLELISTTEADSVSRCRPLKVLNYLQGEAVRMARKLPPLVQREEVLELQDQMTSILPDGCRACLHDRPFCHPIYDMDDLPQTQSGGTQEVSTS